MSLQGSLCAIRREAAAMYIQATVCSCATQVCCNFVFLIPSYLDGLVTLAKANEIQSHHPAPKHSATDNAVTLSLSWLRPTCKRAATCNCRAKASEGKQLLKMSTPSMHVVAYLVHDRVPPCPHGVDLFVKAHTITHTHAFPKLVAASQWLGLGPLLLPHLQPAPVRCGITCLYMNDQVGLPCRSTRVCTTPA